MFFLTVQEICKDTPEGGITASKKLSHFRRLDALEEHISSLILIDRPCAKKSLSDTRKHLEVSHVPPFTRIFIFTLQETVQNRLEIVCIMNSMTLTFLFACRNTVLYILVLISYILSLSAVTARTPGSHSRSPTHKIS